MKRHTLVCRFGANDSAKVGSAWPDGCVSAVDFIGPNGKFNHGLGNAISELSALGLQPQDAGFDLALLGAMVFGADTRIPRGTEAQDGWTREIEISIPVHDVQLWNKITGTLEVALKFLTGDIWKISPRKRPKEHKIVVGSVQAELKQFSCVSLFSGGMDSYIGAIDHLHNDETPLFVSHYLSHTSKDQVDCMKHLKAKYKESEAEFFRANVGFDIDTIPALSGVKGYAPEHTERSRSFLFFSLAALAANGIGKNITIFVPENGLIALNVPLDWLRLGANSTRTTHPFFMARFNEILHGLNISAKLVNQYRFQTKGEMAAQCRNASFLKQTVHETMSCSSSNKSRYKKLPPQHCGYCMPCLIRRASILAAFGKDTTVYTENLAGTLHSDKAAGEHVRSFQIALQRIKSNPLYAASAIRIPGPLTDCEKDVPQLVDMYRRGMEEVGKLLKNVKTKPL